MHVNSDGSISISGSNKVDDDCFVYYFQAPWYPSDGRVIRLTLKQAHQKSTQSATQGQFFSSDDIQGQRNSVDVVDHRVWLSSPRSGTYHASHQTTLCAEGAQKRSITYLITMTLAFL